MMRIHHLNCGSLDPPGEPMVCHVLLLEVDSRLVLVDTGFGTADVADPRRLGAIRHLTRPALRAEETAWAQLWARGLDPRDVRDIVLTHGDLDHAGGIGDFPGARVHLLAAERDAALRPRGSRERMRYRAVHWEHTSRLIGHRPGSGSWHGLEGLVELDEVAPGMMLVPLPGHTAGHAGIALPVGGGWLLHAGDAFHSTAALTTGRNHPGVQLRQAVLAQHPTALRRTQRRLSALASQGGVGILNSHDRALLELCQEEGPYPD